MKSLNKVVLVTGSSRGIGRATALEFAKRGVDVVINYHGNEDDANVVVKQIQDMGRKVISIKCDVSQEEQVKQMIEKIINEFGRLDVLVNNAGIVFDVPFVERTVEQWKRTLEVNLIGTFLCSKYVSNQMLKQGGGKIVNVSSTNADNSFSPEAMDYDASKAGISILTRNLAKELAPTIQVNAVAPGWVDTDMNKDLPKDFVKEEISKIYLKRFAKPEEIAIVFLASDDASYITGTILKIDGGYS